MTTVKQIYEMQDRIAELSNLLIKQENLTSMYQERKNNLLSATEGLVKYAHRIAEMAEIEDNHPFWAWIEDASDCISKEKQMLAVNEKDDCEICGGEKGGTKGNENIINGVVMCDYCSFQHQQKAEAE